MKDLFNTLPEWKQELQAEQSRDAHLAYDAACQYAETGTLEGIATEALDALATACAFEVQDRTFGDRDKHPELF